MTSVLTSYQPTLEEKKSINGFFFCRYLSNHPKAIHIANAFNYFYKEIPIEVQYNVAKVLVTKERIKFIQFPKKTKEENEIINNISRYYKVSNETATEYYSLMGTEERIKFRDLYKEGMQ